MSSEIRAYYNEIDPFAAAWLRELIKQGHIAPGDVDERSIVDVRPAELSGYTQCHFFAGIGVWSYALRKAGWPDSRNVWTGSCPCQPFSAAGKGGGFDDERHLWPAFYHLIGERGPTVVFGEQVASKGADPWIDLVQTDMEALGYAFGAVPFPSAGVGAPHIRDRTYWVADALCGGAGNDTGQGVGAQAAPHSGNGHLSGERLRLGLEGPSGRLDDPAGARHERALGISEGSSRDETRLCLPDAGREISRMAYADGGDAGAEWEQRGGEQRQLAQDGGSGERGRDLGIAGPTNGIWRDADWLFCRDDKWRPVEPSTFPLAHGAPARVGRLRGYGNAINAEAATAFIEACG